MAKKGVKVTNKNEERVLKNLYVAYCADRACASEPIYEMHANRSDEARIRRMRPTAWVEFVRLLELIGDKATCVQTLDKLQDERLVIYEHFPPDGDVKYRLTPLGLRKFEPLRYRHSRPLPHDGVAEQDKDNAPKGVSMQALAMLLADDERELATRYVKEWRNVRTVTKPKPIGKDLRHKQRDLYEPAALLRFVKSLGTLSHALNPRTIIELRAITRPVREPSRNK